MTIIAFFEKKLEAFWYWTVGYLVFPAERLVKRVLATIPEVILEEG